MTVALLRCQAMDRLRRTLERAAMRYVRWSAERDGRASTPPPQVHIRGVVSDDDLDAMARHARCSTDARQ